MRQLREKVARHYGRRMVQFTGSVRWAIVCGCDPKEVFSKDGLFDELKKALAERVLNVEVDDHLDGEGAAGKANHRNGYSKKTMLTERSKIDIKIPRDREGTFDPKLIQRYQRRFRQ
jgi:putative transposase